MINAKTEKGQTSVMLNGGFSELCADSVCVITGIYQAFQQESNEVAEEFKEFFKKNIDKAFSCEDKTMLAKTSSKDEMRKLLEHLKEMIGDLDED